MNLFLVFVVILAAVFSGTEAKCSLAPLDAERRGERKVAYVCIHGDLADLDNVPSEADWIEFTVAKFNTISANAFTRFKGLRRLTFYNCEIRELDPNAFAGLDNLEWLVMSNTKMAAGKASMFKNIPNLTMLTLDNTGLIYIEPEVWKILSKRLEVLSLRNNDLDCIPVDALKTMERLKTMRIDDNPWMCDCRKALLSFFEEKKIQQGSSDGEFDHHRKKRWQSHYYRNESYSTRTSNRVYDCMAVLEYPPLPPAHALTTLNSQSNYDYSFRNRIEWREATASSISYLDRLPDEVGWIELYDIRIPTIRRYTFFRFGNSLRSITIKNCGVEFIEPEAFAGLHKLERLSLIGARLPLVANYWFRDLSRLTDLTLEKSFIEKFEYGALDHLRNLRRLDLRANRLSCLPQENLQGLISLERIVISENPWLCSCRRDLESYLIKKQIGYEISSNSLANGPGCFEETGYPNIVYETKVQDFYNYTTSGRVRWSWGYETPVQRPIQSPAQSTPRPPVVVETTAPPMLMRGGCRAVPSQRYHHHDRYNHLRGHTYVCSQATLLDLASIPSTIETIIFSNSQIGTINSDIFRKFDGFLKRLEFRDCFIQEINHRAFGGLHNLESLVIRDNDIQVVRSEWFDDIRNIRHLDLAKNNIGKIDNGVFEQLPYLVSIDISDNSMNCIGIEHLEKLRYLRELSVYGNPWTCLCATRLAHLIEDRNVYCAGRCLNDILLGNGDSNWSGCQTSGVLKPKTSHPPPLTTTSTTAPYPDIPVPLTNISGTCFSTNEHTYYHCSNGDKFLLSNIPSYVRSIEIYDSYVPHLPAATFLRFQNLTELTLRNCSLRDIDPRAFQGLRRLEKLTIKDNRFSVVENEWFKECENLYWLDLSHNNLVEIETGAFDDLKRLQYLNLEDNMFQCIYTSTFVNLPRIDTLEFGRNPLKWRCWQDLRQFLEVRAIGYTYYKCPHDSRALVKNLQNDKKSGSLQTNSARELVLNFLSSVILVTTIIFSLY